MKLQISNRIAIFIISFITWLLITSFTDIQEIAAGLVVALLVTLLSWALIPAAKIGVGFKKIYHLVVYFLIMLWEIVKTGFYMAWVVLHPGFKLQPAIVKVKTGLKNETALTILANSLTLTSGTLTVEVDQMKGFLYIHCLRVPADTTAIGAKFEKRLREIFE